MVTETLERVISALLWVLAAGLVVGITLFSLIDTPEPR